MWGVVVLQFPRALHHLNLSRWRLVCAGPCWETLPEIPWGVEASSLLLCRDPDAEAPAETFCSWALTARSEGTWQRVLRFSRRLCGERKRAKQVPYLEQDAGNLL